MRSILIGTLLWLMAAFFAPSVFAEHNVDRQGHDVHRGYTAENCEAQHSTSTKLKTHWLGHKIGCLIPEIDHYVLMTEYQILFLFTKDGIDLMLAHMKHGDNLRLEIRPDGKVTGVKDT